MYIWHVIYVLLSHNLSVTVCNQVAIQNLFGAGTISKLH